MISRWYWLYEMWILVVELYYVVDFMILFIKIVRVEIMVVKGWYL